MNKFLHKVMGKWKLVAIVVSVLLVLGAVMQALFGFNVAPTVGDVKTLTVRYESNINEKSDALIEELCETKIRDADIMEKYHFTSNLSGEKVHEYVYTFSAEVDGEKLEVAKTALVTAFNAEKVKEDSPLFNSFIYVSVNEVKAVATLANGFVWRAFLALGVLCIGAFAYSAIRHGVNSGIMTAVSGLLSVGLAIALTTIVRIPVTGSVAYTFAFAGLLTVSVVSLFMGNVKKALKDPENAEKTEEDVVLQALDQKGMSYFVVALLVGIVLLGAIAVTPIAWLAVSAVVALVSSVVVSFLLLPGICAVVKKVEKKAKDRKGKYQGKKKEVKAE